MTLMNIKRPRTAGGGRPKTAERPKTAPENPTISISLSPAQRNIDSSVVFAFGRRGTFYFEYNGERRWNNLPDGMIDLLKSKHKEDKVKNVVCVSFTHRGGWCVLYRSCGGCYKLSASSDIPPELLSWLKGKNTQFSSNFKQKTVRFSIGANNQFFASARGADGKAYYRWKGLPTHAEETLQYYLASSPGNHRSTWNMVLGSGDSYVFYQQSANSPENAVRSYSSKEKTLRDVVPLVEEVGDDLRGCYIALNQHTSGQYFFVRRDGSTDKNLGKVDKSSAKSYKEIEELSKNVLMDRREAAPEFNLSAIARHSMVPAVPALVPVPVPPK